MDGMSIYFSCLLDEVIRVFTGRDSDIACFHWPQSVTPADGEEDAEDERPNDLDGLI